MHRFLSTRPPVVPLVLAFLGAWLLFPAAGRPQIHAKSDWDVYMDRSAVAFKGQNYPEAEKQAKLALEFSSRFHPEDFRVELTHKLLGQIYQAQNLFAEAEASFQNEIKVHHYRVNSNDDQAPDCLEDLAQLYEAEGKYAEAEPLRLRALKMMVDTYDGKGNWVAERMEYLAALYAAEQKYVEADKFYEKSVKLKEEQYGRESTQLAYPLRKRAEILDQLGHRTEATALRERASRLLEKH